MLFVQKKSTGATATNKITIAAPKSGNALALFVSQTGSSTEPSLTGWTKSGLKANGSNSSNGTWLLTRTADGTEGTSLEVTAGTGGEVRGLTFFESEGVLTTVESSVTGTAGTGAHTATSGNLTCGVDAIIAACGGSATASGVVAAWGGTGPVLERTTETSSQCLGGGIILAEPLSAKNFTANWTNNANYGLLVVALKSSGASNSRSDETPVSVAESTARALAAPRATSDTVAVAESTARLSGKSAFDTLDVAIATKVTTKALRTDGEMAIIEEETVVTQGRPRSASESISIAESPSTHIGKTRLASEAISVADVEGHIRSRNFRLTEALSIVDTFLVTLPPPPPPPKARYTPSTQEVAALIRARTKIIGGAEVGDFNTQTRPTDAEAIFLIGYAEDDVLGKVQPVTTPGSEYEARVRGAIALYAAILIELSFFPEQVNSGRSPAPMLKELYESRIKALIAEGETGEPQGEGDTDGPADPAWAFPVEVGPAW